MDKRLVQCTTLTAFIVLLVVATVCYMDKSELYLPLNEPCPYGEATNWGRARDIANIV